MKDQQMYYAQGKTTIKRILQLPLLPLAWFAPHRKLRVIFHKFRGVKIGKNVEIGYFCIIGNVHPHMIIIEDDAVVTARTTILEHDNSHFYTGRGNVKFGQVIIKRNAFIGIGSVIMPGVVIGEFSIIGALSFIRKNIPPHSIYAGNPAKEIGIK